MKTDMETINKAKDLLKTQGVTGNWDYDQYMHGMYNGMELIIAVIEDREPVYKDTPKEWIKDKPTGELTEQGSYKKT